MSSETGRAHRAQAHSLYANLGEHCVQRVVQRFQRQLTVERIRESGASEVEIDDREMPSEELNCPTMQRKTPVQRQMAHVVWKGARLPDRFRGRGRPRDHYQA